MACLTPMYKRKDESPEYNAIPCGKCPQCIARRVSAWSFRLMQEYRVSETAHFLTLTYDSKHIPITKNGFMSLDKADMQKFMKRLRKNLHNEFPNNRPIKYYLAGEYGGRSTRPHYHIIMFNLPSTGFIEQAWARGSIHYGAVNEASVGYTLKYMDKPKRIPLHRNDDRVPEFSLMSKGIGANYLTPDMIAWHKNDLENRMFCNLLDGKKIAMPRYYKDKIYDEEERAIIARFFVMENEIRDAEEHQKNPNYDWEKLQSHLAQFKKQKSTQSKRDKL